MKKIFLLALASVICLQAFPQEKLVRYQGEVVLGYSFGVGKTGVDKSNVQMINGIRIGKYLAVGLGVGFDHTSNSLNGFSIFGNMKGYLPVHPKISLFCSADIGGGWGDANLISFRGVSGVIVVPALGASIKVSRKSAVNISLAYTHQALGKNRELSLANFDALGLKAGFQF